MFYTENTLRVIRDSRCKIEHISPVVFGLRATHLRPALRAKVFVPASTGVLLVVTLSVSLLAGRNSGAVQAQASLTLFWSVVPVREVNTLLLPLLMFHWFAVG